jgi:hypothetical protein
LTFRVIKSVDNGNFIGFDGINVFAMRNVGRIHKNINGIVCGVWGSCAVGVMRRVIAI